MSDEDKEYPPLVYVPRPPPRHNDLNDRRITYRGETATLREWAIRQGLGNKRRLLADRLYRRGWTIEKALTTPKQHLHFGEVRDADK